MADAPTPLHPTEEPTGVEFAELAPDENPETEEQEALPPPPPQERPTIGEIYGPDAASIAGLVRQISNELRIKPELAFKYVETAINYHLAARGLNIQQQAQAPSWMPPGTVDAEPYRRETTDTEEDNG